MKKVRIATQLYPLRVDAARDLHGVLKAIAEMGYDGVEFCGLFGHEAAELRGWLDELGLVAVSNHMTLDELANPPAVIEMCRVLGCSGAVLGFLTEDQRHNTPAFAKTVEIMRAAAAALKAEGLDLAYHNHNFEFQNAEGGNGLKRILDAVPELNVQFDTGWLAIGGQDPLQWLDQYAGRYTAVHLKDYLSDIDLGYDFCPIGMGDVLDYAAIVEKAVQNGATWLIVDQDNDTRRTSLEAAKLSVDFLRSLEH